MMGGLRSVAVVVALTLPRWSSMKKHILSIILLALFILVAGIVRNGYGHTHSPDRVEHVLCGSPEEPPIRVRRSELDKVVRVLLGPNVTSDLDAVLHMLTGPLDLLCVEAEEPVGLFVGL